MSLFIDLLGNIDEKKEIKYKKLRKKRKIKNFILKAILVILILILTIYFIGLMEKFDEYVCQQIRTHNIPFNKNYFDIVNNLFSVQATMSTLIVSFVSIFSGFIKEKAYGINIPNYIFNFKKFKINIFYLGIILFLLNMINLWFLIRMAYFMCIIIFLITITCILYIMYKIFNLMSNYENIKKQIYNYVKSEIINSYNKMQYKNSKETEINYLLEENHKLQKPYNKFINLVKDLHNDTILKINENDFNNYQININLFEELIIDLDINGENKLKNNLFRILMERIYDLIGILINNKKTSLAYDLLDAISSKIKIACMLSKINLKACKENIYLLDYSSEIERLLYSYKKENKMPSDKAKTLIMDYQYYIILYIKCFLEEKNYDIKSIYLKASLLIYTYILGVKDSISLGKEEKDLIIINFKEKIIKNNYLNGFNTRNKKVLCEVEKVRKKIITILNSF